ncbi:myoxvirus resistance protein B [Arapaima gigas]
MDGVFPRHLDERIRPYIDLIDSLRTIGIEKDLALPAIAVIGDQSSGKSSVLETLSGVALPRGSGIVTRCPLELKLRKLRVGVTWRAVISYREEYIEFCDPSMVEEHVVKAQDELAGEGVGISEELISLEIMSPDVCDLTLIDLPGIARVPVGNQPEDIADQIKRLILKFIEKTETINLVVVPCNVDIATTEALRMAKKVDPEGQRTLAILTKPDLADKGTEKNILEIFQNQVIPLQKGYMMVKCRGQKQIDDKVSLEEATKMEMEFFSSHPDFRFLLDDKRASIGCLASKLTQDLVDHIKMSLPLLTEKIKKHLWETRNALRHCEHGPPLELHKRKKYLINMLTEFDKEITTLSNGERVGKENIFVFLRSEFKKLKGQLDNTKEICKEICKTVQQVVNDYDSKHRGRELPGIMEYKIFEKTVQNLIMELEIPAISTLHVVKGTFQEQFTDVAKTWFQNFPFLERVAVNKIANIQSKQEAKVMQRIHEQFEIEYLIYTQDETFFKELNDGMASGRERVVTRRLADQVPLLIRLFILKESAKLLCGEMLNLIDGASLNDILREETESSRRRIDLQKRLERLSIAQSKISNFC